MIDSPEAGCFGWPELFKNHDPDNASSTPNLAQRKETLLQKIPLPPTHKPYFENILGRIYCARVGAGLENVMRLVPHQIFGGLEQACIPSGSVPKDRKTHLCRLNYICVKKGRETQFYFHSAAPDFASH